ncbi:hypothetical protein [Oleidesulfovibrio sp.]|uniref:hypothetical protein n=1 Tax=Oleidesulfovibrio sp. TaxID=2909707 RepID=UPI003A8AA8F4
MLPQFSLSRSSFSNPYSCSSRMGTILALMVIITAGILLGGCSSRTQSNNVEKGLPSSEVPRADPGYVQWLSRQSMLDQSERLTEIVSGSHLQWRKGGLRPAPASLLREADTWLTIRPESILSKSNEPVFAVLSDKRVWQALQSMGIRGMLPSPVHVTGGLWGYDLTAVRGDDVIQYNFADACGSADIFAQLMRAANAHGAILGTMLVPAATGLGPDFFLAARGKEGYDGLYGIIEVPRKLWKHLPDAPSEWQGQLLSPDATEELRKEGLLPPALAAVHINNPLRWAVTGEVRGIDGELRRWVYLAHKSPSRPVLNWNDPSAAAKRVFSGSIIRQVGELGTALAGLDLTAFAGAVVDEGDQRGPATPLLDASREIASEVRRYGGWSLLTNSMQLPLLKAILDSGPDMAVDRYASPAAAHALLTGDAEPLRLTMTILKNSGIDHRRMMHPVLWGNGIDYSMPQLAEPPFGQQTALQWRGTRKPAAAIQRDIINDLRKNVDEQALHTVTAEHTFCTTPAGIAAHVLGIKDQRYGLREVTPEVTRGTLLLAAWNALLPGGFILDGRDIAGAMPLPPVSLPQEDVKEHPELLAHGAYALDSATRNIMVSRQGLPRAKMLNDSLPAQILHEASYASGIKTLLQLRRDLGIPLAELVALPETGASGVAATVLALPPTKTYPSPRWLAVVANFSRETIEQSIPLKLPPKVVKTASDMIPHKEPFITLQALADEQPPASLTAKGNNLLLTLRPWQIRAIVLDGKTMK